MNPAGCSPPSGCTHPRPPIIPPSGCRPSDFPCPCSHNSTDQCRARRRPSQGQTGFAEKKKPEYAFLRRIRTGSCMGERFFAPAGVATCGPVLVHRKWRWCKATAGRRARRCPRTSRRAESHGSRPVGRPDPPLRTQPCDRKGPQSPHAAPRSGGSRRLGNVELVLEPPLRKVPILYRIYPLWVLQVTAGPAPIQGRIPPAGCSPASARTSSSAQWSPSCRPSRETSSRRLAWP